MTQIIQQRLYSFFVAKMIEINKYFSNQNAELQILPNVYEPTFDFSNNFSIINKFIRIMADKQETLSLLNIPKREPSMRSLASQSIAPPSNSNKVSQINQLYSKFLTLNSMVNVQYDISSFNMAQFDKEDIKVKYDQQMVIAKLKRLQNNAELKRADMELEQRKKKVFRVRKRDQTLFSEKQSYLNTFKRLTLDSTLNFYEQQNKTESEDEGHNGAVTDRPQGISYFNELKRHPKILKYTIQKMKSRQLSDLQDKNSKIQQFQTFKNQIKTIAHTTMMKNKNKPKGKEETNPQKIADSIFRKIYTKKNKQASIAEARTDSRLNRFIYKQDQILDTLDERSLSKENYKKLKSKFNEIIGELYNDERKHNARIFLPKISANATATGFKH